VTFEVLRDQGNATARRYGIAHALPLDLQQVYRGFGLDLPVINGGADWTLPMPARFVIDRGGIVRSVDVDPDYTRRPEPAATVAILRGLS
jgi:peroxiredoxin